MSAGVRLAQMLHQLHQTCQGLHSAGYKQLQATVWTSSLRTGTGLLNTLTMLRSGLLILSLLALTIVTLAQPCIECRTCKTDNCRRACKKECPKTVDIEKCRRFGDSAGVQVGRDACGTVTTYCRGNTNIGVGRGRSGFQVPLSQCENIAYGACQVRATATAQQNQSTCRAPLLNQGAYLQCTRTQWLEFFNGEVNELCERAVAKIDP